MEGGNGFERCSFFFRVKKPSNPVKTIMTEKDANLAILLVTLLGWFSDPFKWLSDLQLGDEKVTLNQLDSIFFFWIELYNNWMFPKIVVPNNHRFSH